MKHIIISILVICSTECVQSFPIKSGFSVKLNPITMREELRSSYPRGFFAKIPQDLASDTEHTKELLSKAYFAHPTDLGNGCTNQIAKIIFPLNSTDNDTWDQRKYISLPIIKQPFDDYKILVATAPPSVKIGGDPDGKPTVIYVVFPDDSIDDSNPINIPSIYFVNKMSPKFDVDKKEKADPMLIVDSNRTVTGLKSNAVEKYVKFKNKLIDRYNYEFLP